MVPSRHRVLNRARVGLLPFLVVALAFAGCLEPKAPSLPDAEPPGPPAAAAPIDYAGCRRFAVGVHAPKDEVQALLPDGFEAVSGLTVQGNPTPPGFASLHVTFLGCSAVGIRNASTATATRIVSVAAAVIPAKDVGAYDNMFLLEHYVSKDADPLMLAAFQAAHIPATAADISFDATDAPQFSHATVEVVVDGATPIQYDALWKPDKAPAHALVTYRNPARIHLVTEGVHRFYDDLPGEAEQETYVFPYTVRAEGGALSQIATGDAGVLVGYGESTVVQGVWKLAS